MRSYNRFLILILILFMIHLLTNIFSKKNSTTLTYISDVLYSANNNNDKINLNENEKSLLEDVLIVVKTSSKNHQTRIKNIVSTWYQFAKDQVYAITDTFDQQTNELLGGKLVPTDCAKDRNGLCCKFGSELNLYFSLKKQFKWFCHVDDDNYINIKNLVKLLSKYNHNEYHYLGKSSWNVPVVRNGPKKFLPEGYAKFWFGTFGAGVCLSNATMYKIKNHSNKDEYKNGCLNMGLPDDTYLGFLLEWKNKIYFENITTMNHHLEIDEFKNMQKISDQVSFSFGRTYFKYFNPDCNCEETLFIIPQIENIYGDDNDPFRIKTLHCLLYPETSDCKSMLIKALEKSYLKTKEISKLNSQILKNNRTLNN